MMSHGEIKHWLTERGINGYSGSIGVEDVIITLEAFQKLGDGGSEIVLGELRRIRKLVESVKETVEAS